MNRKLFSILLCMTAILWGCGKPQEKVEQPSEPVKKEQQTSTTTELPVLDIPMQTLSENAAAVSEFNLGKKEYQAASGKTMPYQIRGVIGIPEGNGTYPLVLIAHGSHENEVEGPRFDTGFTYLVQALASHGFIAVAMDVSHPYLWRYGDGDDREKVLAVTKEQIAQLRLASEGTNPGYEGDLTGKIDWNKVCVIGHSRGGSTAFDIALELQKDSIGVGAVMAIAPAQTADMEAASWPDCPISILVPAYDGDVVSLDGFYIDSILNANHPNMHALTYLYKANHNYFNSNLTDNDALLARDETQLADQMSKEDQQAFLTMYTIDFLNAAALGQTENTIYAPAQTQPNTLYGKEVLTRIAQKGKIDLTDASHMGDFESNNLSIGSKNDSWFYEDDQITIDTVTFGNEAYKIKPLLETIWEDKTGSFTIVPAQSDWSSYTTLAIGCLPDSSNELNGEYQSYSIELKDTAGNTAKAVLPASLNALKKTPGKPDMTPIGEIEYHFWAPATPIGEILIPLSIFEGVDFKNIESLSFYFDQTEQGSLYFEHFRLQ